MNTLNKVDERDHKNADASGDALLNGSIEDTVRKLYEDQGMLFGTVEQYDVQDSDEFVVWFGQPHEDEEETEECFLRLYPDNSWNMNWS